MPGLVDDEDDQEEEFDDQDEEEEYLPPDDDQVEEVDDDQEEEEVLPATGPKSQASKRPRSPTSSPELPMGSTPRQKKQSRLAFAKCLELFIKQVEQQQLKQQQLK